MSGLRVLGSAELSAAAALTVAVRRPAASVS
jgi:hypothetical protein